MSSTDRNADFHIVTLDPAGHGTGHTVAHGNAHTVAHGNGATAHAPKNGGDIHADDRGDTTGDNGARLADPTAGDTTPRGDGVAAHVTGMLHALGEDPSRNGLLRTPERVERSMRFLTSGYDSDVHAIVNGALFEEEYREMVVVKDIEVFSLCEHHLLPFFGRVHVAYIPNGRILGLSKVARVVEMFARRLQVQERMTRQIAEALQEVLHPLGVAVVIEARHLCMVMRGVEKTGSTAMTRLALGSFADNSAQWTEFLTHMGRPSGRDL